LSVGVADIRIVPFASLSAGCPVRDNPEMPICGKDEFNLQRSWRKSKAKPMQRVT
jgi:hypothetical protein